MFVAAAILGSHGKARVNPQSHKRSLSHRSIVVTIKYDLSHQHKLKLGFWKMSLRRQAAGVTFLLWLLSSLSAMEPNEENIGVKMSHRYLCRTLPAWTVKTLSNPMQVDSIHSLLKHTRTPVTQNKVIHLKRTYFSACAPVEESLMSQTVLSSTNDP